MEANRNLFKCAYELYQALKSLVMCWRMVIALALCSSRPCSLMERWKQYPREVLICISIYLFIFPSVCLHVCLCSVHRVTFCLIQYNICLQTTGVIFGYQDKLLKENNSLFNWCILKSRIKFLRWLVYILWSPGNHIQNQSNRFESRFV